MVNIAGIEIGAGHPCRFVCEISNNHNGDRDRCGRLIDAAKDAGADFVKFQCYTPDELVALRGDGPAPEPWGAQGYTMRTLYERAATPFDWFPKIKAHCERVGIPWFSSVFGEESFQLLWDLGCRTFKAASLDRQAMGPQEMPWLRKHRAHCNWIASSPSAHEGLSGIDWANCRLYCPPGYPTPLDAVKLPQMGDGNCDCHYPRDHYFHGVSLHCLDPQLPIVAVARGCKLIEMHMMLQEEPSELESNVSLTQYGFAEMVKQVRATEVLLGHS